MFEVLLVMTRSYDEWKKKYCNICTCTGQLSHKVRMFNSEAFFRSCGDKIFCPQTEKEQTEVINENKLLYFLNIFLSYIIVGLAN